MIASHDYNRLAHRGFMRLESHDRRKRIRHNIYGAFAFLAFLACLYVVGGLK